MLMKWKDLEVGDKIKWREEAIDDFENGGNREYGYYCYYSNTVLTIEKIIINSYEIIIYYYRDPGNLRSITIDHDGGHGECDGEVFEIIELRKD